MNEEIEQARAAAERARLAREEASRAHLAPVEANLTLPPRRIVSVQLPEPIAVKVATIMRDEKKTASEVVRQLLRKALA